jgi:DNA polymerase-1
MDLTDVFTNEQTSQTPLPQPIAEVAPVTNGPEKTTKTPNVYRTFEDYPLEDMLLYAGVDTYVTSNAVSRQFPAFVEAPLYKTKSGAQTLLTRVSSLIDVYDQCTGPMFEFLVDLEISGINYDPVENRRLDVSMRNDIAALEDSILSNIGRSINLNSADDLSRLLYVERGFTPPSRTKSGEPSTDGDALLILAGIDPKSPGKYIASNPEHQYLADLAKRKNLASVHRGFIDRYMDDYLDPDGRIHAHYNQFGTSTFRLSSSDPNLQNVPRAFGVKKCFNTRPGYLFMCFDFSSAEIKLLAAICKDAAMLSAIEAGMDFHSFAASNMFSIPYDEFVAVLNDKSNPLSKDYKAKRQVSKALGFAILYGSSARGIAMNLAISEEEAEKFISLYFKAFPGLKQYVEETHFAALNNQYVITPLGHRRQFYGTYPEFKKTAAFNAALRGSQNYIIQSATAVVGALSFCQISRELTKIGGVCTATVHDSLEAEVPIGRAAEALEVFFYYMNDWPQKQFKWLGLSIGCEGEVGHNWGDCEVVHRGATQEEIMAVIGKREADNAAK